MKRRSVLGMAVAALGAAAGASVALAGSKEPAPTTKGQGDTMGTAATNKIEKISKTDAEWKKELTPEEYYVLREEGTERAFTGKYWNDPHDDKAVYVCAACGLELFSGEAKFDSGTGWPSYYQPIKAENVETRVDKSFFMSRTEVHCARCGGHLGHVFEDGPKPTGLRYCINGVSLDKK
jgi:peptide-methionine (R)-S-oxide reductase